MGGRRLVETMVLENGPHAGLLTAARDRLCAEALAAGVTLVLIEDWAELERLNLRYRSGWFPLLPRPASAPSFWIGAADMEGEIVATHGVVLIDCAGISTTAGIIFRFGC